MFHRAQIKEFAKISLKRRYWMVVAVIFVGCLLGGAFAPIGSSGVNFNTDSVASDVSDDMDVDVDADVHNTPNDNPWLDGGNAHDPQNDAGNLWPDGSFRADDLWSRITTALGEALPFVLGVVSVVVALAVLFGILITVFLSNVVTVGIHGWLLRHWRGEDTPFSELFACFRIYKPSVVIMLVRGIYTFLWSLLLVIPGIVKAYAYSMVPYIIYENPNLTANQAITISRKMTDGYKWELFVLQWSFFGWNLLSAITGGLVGIFWTNPYIGLTYAATYDDLKQKAIASGKLDWSDFGQLPPPPVEPDPYGNTWSAPTDWHTPSWQNCTTNETPSDDGNPRW